MNYRELFHEIMFYGQFDRMPVIHWGGWPETHERWYGEGLPREANQHEFFKAVPPTRWPGFCNVGLFPEIEYELLEDTPEYKVYRNGEGVICKEWRGRSSIPHYMDYTFKTAKDWDNFKKRLQPDPARILSLEKQELLAR